MDKRPLYFNKVTKTQLESLQDALHRTLQIDDFVTAVFKDGELTLFKVIGFEHEHIDYFVDYDQLSYAQKGIVVTRTSDLDFVILQRVQGTNAFSTQNNTDSKKHNAKPVYKTSKQVAYADPNFVMLHYLGA